MALYTKLKDLNIRFEVNPVLDLLSDISLTLWIESIYNDLLIFVAQFFVFQEFKHPAARTAEDMAVIFKDKPFQQVKNLFLYDKRKRFYLISALSVTQTVIHEFLKLDLD